MGVLGSQAGHLLAYQLLFGSGAQQIQSSGSHAYFPALAKTFLGAGAAVLLLGLLLVGLARVTTGRRVAADTAPHYLRLLAGLYTIQFGCFAGQETTEAMVSGSAATSVSLVILVGTLGQLPVAAVAALALRWLLARVGPALSELLLLFQPAAQPAPLLPGVVAVPIGIQAAVLQSRVAASSLSRRGPPSSLRFSPD